MLKVEKLEEIHIELIVTSCERNHLPFHEYPSLSMIQILAYFNSKLKKAIHNTDTIAYITIDENKIQGLIICVKNNFDTDNFGFGCYNITDLLVFSKTISQTNAIIDKLISTVEEELFSKTKPVYIALSLNNNIHNADQIFNALTGNQYYYIHTLLTFFSEKKQFEATDYYSKENLTIRNANLNDIEQVADLAKKSFKYSRFHLDPFLDNFKASELLRTSAINSIRHNFVDIMFVAEINNRIVGYYSGKKTRYDEFDKTIGSAVISAVDIERRGKGIFSKLDAHLLNWFCDQTDFAEMGTYLANYPVHKTWINKGLGLIRGTHQFSKIIS